MTDQPTNLPAKTQLTAGGTVAALIPQSLDEAFRLSQALSLSGLAPRGMDKPEQIMVAIIAGAELGLAPFQSLQSFAVVNGRPTLWGDGLMAVARSQGVQVREWVEGEDGAWVAHCEVTRPDTGEQIKRTFSVDDAKKASLWGKQGPWQSYPRRMLGMRARAYALRDGCADMLRGFQVREEVEDYQPIREVAAKADLRAKLAPPKPDAEGFSREHVAQETREGTAVVETIDETLDGDDIPTEREERPTETVSAPTVEAGQGSVASATPAPTDSQEPAASDTTEPEADVISEGYPEAGEVYFVNGDEWVFNPERGEERRETYKGGMPFSDAGRGKHAIYEDHAPEVAKDPEPAPTDAPAALPPELQTYVDALEAAESWKAIKTAMGTFYKSATFEALDEDGKNKIRRQTWPYVVDLQDLTPPETIDQASDVSAFRLWIEYTSDPDAIDGTLPILAKSEEFAKLPDASQNGIRLAAKKRVDALRGA